MLDAVAFCISWWSSGLMPSIIKSITLIAIVYLLFMALISGILILFFTPDKPKQILDNAEIAKILRRQDNRTYPAVPIDRQFWDSLSPILDGKGGPMNEHCPYGKRGAHKFACAYKITEVEFANDFQSTKNMTQEPITYCEMCSWPILRKNILLTGPIENQEKK